LLIDQDFTPKHAWIGQPWAHLFVRGAVSRGHQPSMMFVWSKNDETFPAAGPYKLGGKDLKYYLIDTGHFALEMHHQEIADLIRDFLDRKVDTGPLVAN
jgi:hypothetical protein